MNASARFGWWVLAAPCAALVALGCGGVTRSQEQESGNTNWLKMCVTDADCGDLTCYCGTCRGECSGATDCSLDPERACLGSAGAPASVAPRLLLDHHDAASYARDFARLADGSLLLVGGTDFTLFDLAPTYPTFWLSKLDPTGDQLWSYTEPPTEPAASNTGISLALLGDGQAVTLTTIYDGNDTPSLRRFDSAGALVETWTSAPGFTQLLSAPGGDLFAAGSNFVDERAGRPFTSSWVGRIDAKSLVWEQARTGTDGSISGVTAASTNDAGDVAVAGYLGITDASNASQPWLARLDQTGQFLWEEAIEVPDRTHCTASAVALTPTGDSLSAIDCGALWLRAYDASGGVRWERRFARQISALAGLADGGYVVGLGTLDTFANQPDATLLRFDAQHRLLWQIDQPGCTVIERIVVTDDSVLSLAGCAKGFALAEYADP